MFSSLLKAVLGVEYAGVVGADDALAPSVILPSAAGDVCHMWCLAASDSAIFAGAP